MEEFLVTVQPEKLPINFDKHYSVAESNWSDVKFYFSGDSYFQSILRRIQNAVDEVRIEIYMFNIDELGKTLLQALAQAQQRGVRVYLLVDGIGTLGFLKQLKNFCNTHRIHFKIYNPLRIKIFEWFKFKNFNWKAIRRFFLIFRKINNRDHRKIFLIDKKIAFVGSHNINKVHSETLSHEKAWRDTGVELIGQPVNGLVDTCQAAWDMAKPDGKYSWHFNYNVLRINERHKQRMRHIRDLLDAFHNARYRIYITTAYFIPNRKILMAMIKAARRGIDVQLCVPETSDLPFMKWTSWQLYDHLIKAGIKIYEYRFRILHAKTMIVDDWATVGSYNFNHRSLIHDLEVEVVINKSEWLTELLQQWGKDISQSKLVMLNDKGHSNILSRIISGIFYWFRYWL